MTPSIRPLLLFALAAALLAALATAILASPASATVKSPDGLWSWSRPTPLGYPAAGLVPAPAPEFATSRAIAAPAVDRLFVATTVGDLLTTTDGGATWGWSPTGSVSGFAQPQSLDFVSSSDGWVSGTDTSGQNGVLLHTSDGGAIWQSNLTVSGVSITNVRFSDPSSGWIVGGDDLEMLGWVASCTTDGGQSWSTPTPLPLNSVGPIEYSDSVFEAFAPRGAASAIFMETDDLVGGNGDDTTVWATSDGGAVWTLADRLPDATIGDVVFSSPLDGWAAGRWLWHTTDGGHRWAKVRMAPAVARIAVEGSEIWVVGQSGALHSGDAGTTWASSPARGSVVAFADASDGWIANGSLYQHTTDGGATWSRRSTLAPAGISTLSAVSGNTVWAAAGRVVVSTDGGAHWRRTTRRAVNAVSAISPRQAWAVGANGRVMHTADGGHHWRLQTIPLVVNHSKLLLICVDFVDARHGWAGAAGGVILRTSDGGRRWAHMHTTAVGWRPQLSFADASHGIAIGSSRTFLVTRNGGRTWSAKQLPSPYYPTAVLTEDSSHALIIARNQCFASSDGGATWQQGAEIPPGNNLAGRDCVSIARSGSLLCAVGRWGDVATSSDGGASWSNEGVVMGQPMSSVQFVGANELIIGGALGAMTRDLTAAPLP
jgi:photosystem II stability/assembly factor-like uncharacterized protein